MGAEDGLEIERAKAAVRALEDACLEAPGGLLASFRLWHYPREGPWITWVVFVPSGGPPYESDGAVRERGWTRQGTPAGPDLWSREASLPPATLRRALSRASHTALVEDHRTSSHAFPDWTEFGIEGFGRTTTPQRIQWEAPAPYPFRTLAVWHSRTRGLLQDCLDRENHSS